MKRSTLFMTLALPAVLLVVGDGDLTASELLQIRLKAEEAWADGKYRDDYMADADGIIKQLNSQTARFRELDNPEKDNQVELTWLKPCDIEVEDFDRTTDVCQINGTEFDSDARTYEMDLLKAVTFSIDDEKLRTNDYMHDELVVNGILRADKQLAEFMNSQYLAFLASEAGANPAVIANKAAPMTWDAPSSSALIPSGSYNIGMVANLIKQSIYNKSRNLFYIENGDLFEEWENAGLNSGNLDGKGDDNRRGKIDLTFDMFGFAASGVSQSMFAVANSAVAIKTYNRYSATPKVMGGKINQTRYSYASNILPGVSYDVIYELKCVDGKDFHTWKFIIQYGMWTNPEPCPIAIGEATYTPNGIYGYTKGA